LSSIVGEHREECAAFPADFARIPRPVPSRERAEYRSEMQTRNRIGAEWVGADDGGEVAVVDPATDEELARVPAAGPREAARAIAAAAAALGPWRERPARERAAILRRAYDGMIERREALAWLLTREQGKPLAEARAEIDYAASFVEWAAEEAKRVYGDLVPSSHADRRILVLRQPVGVTACVTPWNFPAAMITRKLGPALAAGCTMIVKPALETPLTALALTEVFLEAGVPPGVVNVITGDAPPIVDALLASPLVRKLSFTGSTRVGRLLMAKAAPNLTRLSLELGGHAPFLVFDDAELDAAVRGALHAKLRNMGQTCVSANRFLVQEGIHERFCAAFATAMGDLHIGRGTDPGVQVGPLVSDAAIEKVERHVEDARSRGARVLVGGARARPAPDLADRFYAPTLLDGFTAEMLVSQEETFGPVAPVCTFRTEEEGIALANASPYGLAAYAYTRDVGRAFRVAERLEYGIVGLNDGAPSTAQAPFGGVKASGFGREGGKYVMHEYLDIKYVSLGL
jgi:succinate-semialdehyde dehydrogenase/glutarate-semialdehyde dehydrogenase